MSQKVSIFRTFPSTFWVANTMEIFERMCWYGFFAVSALYLTGDPSEGGLGLTSEERGIIQGLVTFFLYLIPSFFGAMADKFGFKKTLIFSYILIAPAYLLLAIPNTFWGFFLVYMAVAVGHGMFKPVIVGSVAKTTDEKTGTLGFGIFYMMVNIGGFIGPMAAGVVRSWGWDKVFYASAAWISLNIIICALFYKEPQHEEGQTSKTVKQVLNEMVLVVGNARFFILIAGLMISLVLGSGYLSASQVFMAAGAWLVLNFVFDAIFRSMGKGPESFWLFQPMRVGETRYLIFLLLMSGFWTGFNQIFMTLPEYIRDYAQTSDLLASMSAIGLNVDAWGTWLLKGGEIKPEYLINLNAFGIIVCQILVSYLCRNLKPFTTIVSGTVITSIAFCIFPISVAGWVVVAGILTFSFGEMMASPKSQEYVGRIAPPDKVGMYMGYFFWCVALGNLFGGLLSGVLYGHYGPKGLNSPNTMFHIIAAILFGSAIALWLYDRWITKHPIQSESASE